MSLQGGANRNDVGGTQPGATNRIAHNGEDGVEIAGSDTTGNSVLSNRIYGNAGLGIDLVGGTEDSRGITANDPGDTDIGSNALQNFPAIGSATRSIATGETTISGRLDSKTDGEFTVQCFLTANGTPASAHGEGLRLLDTTSISIDADYDNGATVHNCAQFRWRDGGAARRLAAVARRWSLPGYAISDERTFARCPHSRETLRLLTRLASAIALGSASRSQGCSPALT